MKKKLRKKKSDSRKKELSEKLNELSEINNKKEEELKRKKKNDFNNESNENDSNSDNEVTENELDDDTDNEKEINDELNIDNELTTVNYTSHEEELILRNLYGSSRLDYEQLFSYDNKIQSIDYMMEENKKESSLVFKTESETMTTEEANNMVQEIQYASLLGTTSSKDHTKKRKFTTWTMFNQEMLMLFHSLYSMTGDVDYSKNF